MMHPCRAQTPGLVPINDLGPGSYLGYQGGLYPGGVNHPPVAHETAAQAAAAQIVPRNAAGVADPNGLIVMIAVGMSNTTHEFGAFERNEDANVQRNARLVLMDTALGGQTAAAISDPTAAYWTTMSQRLAAMGLSAAQVQVAWLKEADAGPPNNFPVHAQTLRDELELVVNNLHDKFPNLRLCYISSRIYGGYAPQGSLNPEPQAYESGFAVKWLIEAQMAGDSGLSYGQLPGPVRAPLLLWGPYLWANGPTPRSDGLVWQPADLEGDMTHPSASGEQKVASLLSAFFAQEATAAAWWRAGTDVGLLAVGAAKDAHVMAVSPSANFGSATSLLVQGGAQPANTYLGFSVAAVPRPVALAKLSLRVIASGGGRVSAVGDTSWSETGITYASAPAIGSQLVPLPGSSRDGTIAANLTSAVNADADGLVSYALSSSATAANSYDSREAGHPPRLVLAVRCAGAPDADGDGRPDPCDCAPGDGSAFARPAEPANLTMNGNGTIAWSSLSGAAGTGTHYDLMSGDLLELSQFSSRALDLCLGSGIAATQAPDTTTVPAPAGGRFFLVKARNACGASRWEAASDGRDRSVGSCP